jgi:hypothetical protein
MRVEQPGGGGAAGGQVQRGMAPTAGAGERLDRHALAPLLQGKGCFGGDWLIGQASQVHIGPLGKEAQEVVRTNAVAAIGRVRHTMHQIEDLRPDHDGLPGGEV